MSRSRLRFAPTFLVLLALASLTPASTRALESGPQCSDCFDNDQDGNADRKDPDCAPPPANGGNVGLGDVARGKVVTACAKTTQKAGVKFVLDVMKRFQKCMQTAEACIHAKPGDAGCQAKANATCQKLILGFDASAAKLQAAIVATCDPTGQSIADLRAVGGLGFSAEETPCLNETAAADLGTIQNVASCIALQHFCAAQRLVAAGKPRALEFLQFAGRPDGEFQCFDDRFAGANGFGAGVDPTHVKKLLKCSKTIDKLSLSLLGAGAKTVQTCLNAGLACLQVKPTDAACVGKARAKCAAGFTKLQDPTKGTVSKLAGKLAKACNSQENFDLNDFRQFNGIGFNAELQRCSDLGSLSPASCLGSQAFCEGGYVIEREVPRARELAAFLKVVIPGIDP